MAAAFQAAEVVTVGTTPQTAVSAPGAGEQKQVLSLLGWNRDSVTHTIIAKKVGGTVTVELGKVVLPAGERGQLLQGGATVLDGTGESITVESDATATTTEPVVDVAVFKVP